jgi:two-component system, LytTR family, sensor kinase
MKQRRIWRIAAIYAGVWTLLGLFDAAQSFVSDAYLHEKAASFWGILGTSLLNWYTCGISTPLYLWLISRLPIKRPHVAARLPVYVVAVVACVIVKYVIWVPLENAIFHTHWQLSNMLVQNFFWTAFGQIAFIAVLYAIELYRSKQERELVASHLQAQLSQLQLQTLRSQLDPHFLFNTLNSISGLMRRDVEAADAMLARLSDMLRAALASDGRQEVQLREELALTSAYVDIMRVRFGDRLHVRLNVDESALDEAVPSFLLQPLVENAIRHGMHESTRTTNVEISARFDSGELVVRVADDGRGLPAEHVRREGVGLRNTRSRLDGLYGGLGTLALTDRAGGGTEVSVRLPRGGDFAHAGAISPR